MDVARVLAELGGISTRARLVKVTARAQVDAALRSGVIVAGNRGCYALPVTDGAVRRAAALSGVLSLTSAAMHHGWEVKSVPERPHVTVPRKRRVSTERRAGVELHRHDVHPDDIATGVELTLTQCLTQLPFDEALAVADSVRHHGAPATRPYRDRETLLEAHRSSASSRPPATAGSDRTPPPTKVALVQRQADLVCPRCSAA